MTTPLTPELESKLRTELKENPGQILEMIASVNQCSLENVIHCLPEEMVSKTDGSRFVEIMQEIAEWDEAVTFIVHTPDSIVEVIGKLPSGEIGRGFYNFTHSKEGGMQGHLRYENCAAIYLLDRPFMGKRTVALTFINHSGEAMFKIFVGRDEKGQLRENQITAMKKLIKGN